MQDLGGIVLEGLPTFFLLVILTFFVKHFYLKPLEKVLAERHRLTEGARKAAEESLQNADSKIGEYQKALSDARATIYKEQAEFLSKLHEEQSANIQEVRSDSERQIAAMKLSFAHEAAVARENLAAQSDALANQIAEAILGQRAA
ncbi:MAG TPA: ATP synthase F0 subunit B [Bryobacteraceae bacterium]|nr:ATP synthase F0 subunit B [Bryobacteraceae bacterium]